MLKNYCSFIYFLIGLSSYSLFAMQLMQEDIQAQFMFAVKENDVKKAAYYLSKGAQLDAADADGKNAIIYLRELGEAGEGMRRLFIERYPGLTDMFKEDDGTVNMAIQAPLAHVPIIPQRSSLSSRVSSLVYSQVRGGVQLLNFGAGVFRQLLGRNILDEQELQDQALVEQKNESNPFTLMNAFLAGEAQFNQQCAFSSDIKRTLKRLFLHNHPFLHYLIRKLRNAAESPTLFDHHQFGEDIKSVAFDCTGASLITQGQNYLKVWSIQTGEAVRRYALPHHSALPSSIPLVLQSNQEFMLHLAEGVPQYIEAMIQDREERACYGILCFAQGSEINEVFDAQAPENWIGKVASPVALDVNSEKEFIVLNTTLRTRTTLAGFKNRENIWRPKSFGDGWDLEMKVSVDKVGRNISTIDETDSVKVWDVQSGLCKKVIPRKFVHGTKFSSDGSILLMRGSLDCLFYDLDKQICFPIRFRENNLIGLIIFMRDETEMRSDLSSNGEIGAVIQEGVVHLINLKRYFELVQWLEKECSFEQALLLLCIYETAFTNALLKIRGGQGITLDFAQFQHLLKHFESIPLEIRELLLPLMRPTPGPDSEQGA